MVHYELVACRNRRWVPDGILGTKDEALAEAHNLMSRDPLVSAVRVMMCEDKEWGLTGRPVCTLRAASIRAADRNAENSPQTARATARSGVHGARIRRSWNGRSLAMAATVIVAALGVLGFGLVMPKQPWAFDSPDAQKPHMLRNTFTGEFTR